MRVAVLPRDEAARVITTAITRCAWAVNAASLALSIPLLVDFLAVRRQLDELGVPLAILLGLLAFAVVGAIFPRRFVAVAFLVAGGVSAVIYEVTLFGIDPGIVQDGMFLLNRPAVSLVLVGAAASTALAGVAWTTLGFAVSIAVGVTVALVRSIPVAFGWGPLLIFVLYVTSYAVLWAIQARQRRQVPDFDALERETRQLAVEENLRLRITAAVHDTLLNDLSIVMNAPDELDDRVTDRLRADIATLTSSEWRTESAGVAVVDDEDSDLRNRIMLVMSDLQWRGLTVQVTGAGTGVYRLGETTALALVDAICACLENVLRHSGVAVAEVDIAYSPEAVTVVVTDTGRGFDPDAVPADRLGIRHSIINRISAVGGAVKIWSRPGDGTSVVMTLPVLEVVSRHEEPTHGDS